MKLRIFFWVLVMSISATVWAQQVPLYSQYTFQKLLLNPAMTASDGETRLSVVGRRQFTGLPTAFNTTAINLQTPLKDGRSRFGLNYVNDQNQMVDQNNIEGLYAFDVPFSDKAGMTLGLNLGYYDRRYNPTSFIVEHEDDETLEQLRNNGRGVVDAGFGVVLYFGQVEVGLSFAQLMQRSNFYNDNYNNSVEFKNSRHTVFHLGYNYEVNEDVSIKPLLIYRSAVNAPGQIDLGLVADMKSKGWIGATYRDGYAFALNAGLHLADRFDVGYNYDFSVHPNRSALVGAHELFFSYKLGKGSQEREPKKTPEVAQKDVENLDRRMEVLEMEMTLLKNRKGNKDTVVVVKETTGEVKPREKQPEKPKRDTPVKTEPATGSGLFYVITGTFGDEKNARQYQNNLNSKGYKTYLKKHNNGFYYIYMDRFKTKEEAKRYYQNNNTKELNLWIKEM
jgi:type IX secretion system PorP/SprF family membrane protein